MKKILSVLLAAMMLMLSLLAVPALAEDQVLRLKLPIPASPSNTWTSLPRTTR